VPLDPGRLFPRKIQILDFSCPTVLQVSIEIVSIYDISLPKRSISLHIHVVVTVTAVNTNKI